MSQSIGELFPQLGLFLTNVCDTHLVRRVHVAAVHLALQAVFKPFYGRAQLSQSLQTLTEFEQQRRVPPVQPSATDSEIAQWLMLDSGVRHAYHH